MSCNDRAKQVTSAAGRPIGDNRNSLTAGPHGPVLLQDGHLIEKLAHLNRERIPERVTHAKGAGAFGEFVVTHDITRYTRAALFAGIGKRTPVFARFSNYRGEKGSADTVRDPRGFAVKFYTEAGNWDFAGNNVPVFYIRDPMRLPDLIHSQKREPATNLESPATQWDFWSQSPESQLAVLMNFSDGGIPLSYRHMDGFSCHAFSWFDAADRRTWIKLRWRSLQGCASLSPTDARRLAGEAPDHYVRDLYQAIADEDFPRWRLDVQLMRESEADDLLARGFPVFDVTKVWPEADFPWRAVGELALNRNPDNYYAQVEQAAFAPGNLVPGMGLSPDRLLQARVFAYPDAQRHRLGVNYQQLEVNAPQCPVHTHYRDGAMRTDANGGDAKNYDAGDASVALTGTEYREPAFNSTGDSDRYDPARPMADSDRSRAAGERATNPATDDFRQAGDYFQSLDPEHQERLLAALAEDMRDISREILDRQLQLFRQVDESLARRLAQALRSGVA